MRRKAWHEEGQNPPALYPATECSPRGAALRPGAKGVGCGDALQLLVFRVRRRRFSLVLPFVRVRLLRYEANRRM